MAGGVEAGEEDHADVGQQPLLRQLLASCVPDAQQVRANGASLFADFLSCLHLRQQFPGDAVELFEVRGGLPATLLPRDGMLSPGRTMGLYDFIHDSLTFHRSPSAASRHCSAEDTMLRHRQDIYLRQ